MKTLYIDCSGGASGDMVLSVLRQLAGLPEGNRESKRHDSSQSYSHRSYSEVKAIIEESDKSEAAKKVALRIYEVIAAAEGKVHKETRDTLHFHEVGRDRAIANALGIGEALDMLDMTETGSSIVVSEIYDGTGFVDCDHGRIPVPVPAVQAMMEECGRTYPAFRFKTCQEVETEMVTPSGLAALIGIGAVPAGGMMFMEGRIVATAETEGTRNTGRGGMRAYLIEK